MPDFWWSLGSFGFVIGHLVLEICHRKRGRAATNGADFSQAHGNQVDVILSGIPPQFLSNPIVRLHSPLILTLCVIITVVVMFTPAVPLGVVGVNADGSENVEWLWQRHAFFRDPGEALERLLPAIISGAILFAVGLVGDRSFASARRGKSLLLMLALLLATWFWHRGVQQSAPMAHRQAKPQWVLYDPSASGYFFEAVYRMHSTEEFLAEYEKRMEEGEVLHVGTHPPGLFLLAKGCLTACRKSPSLVAAIELFTDPAANTTFRFLEKEASLWKLLTRDDVFKRPPMYGGGITVPLTSDELAALQLMSLLSGLAVVVTVLPIASLSGQLFNRQVAWRICCLWGTLPCLAIFAPKSDVLFPLTCTTVLAFAVAGLLSRSHWRYLWLVCAGAVLWLGMMMTLAHLPVVAVLLAFATVRAWQSRGRTLTGDAVNMSAIAVTLVLLCYIWTQATDCNILSVWQWNLKNHAGFYDQFTRTYWKWLLINPLELAFAAGLPLAVTAVVGAVHSIRDVLERKELSAAGVIGATFCLAAGTTIDVLWLSGKNQGEAARLWCFLTPWLLIMAGRALCAARNTAEQERTDGKTAWRRLLVAQLIVATLTVSAVSGFSF